MSRRDCPCTLMSAFRLEHCLVVVYFNGNVTQMHLKYTSFAVVPAMPGGRFSAAHKQCVLLCFTR